MSEARYRPLHPEIFRYEPAFLHPALLRGDPAEVLREDAEQIFNLRVFTESYCRLLVEEAEHCGRWRTAADVETNPYAEDVEDSASPTRRSISITWRASTESIARSSSATCGR